MTAQVRRIAVLVTSLDATAGRQLLTALPKELARDVRKAMASLTAIDPDERRQVLAEFRSQALSASSQSDRSSGTSTPSATGNNSPDRTTLNTTTAFNTITPNASTSNTSTTNTSTTSTSTTSTSPARGGFSNIGSSEPSKAISSADESGHAWQRFDLTTLTDLLRGERPTLIAVVLSQLAPTQAVSLLEQLPRDQHRSIIANLARLGDIDPEAMQAIDEHLAGRIADYGHRRASESETTGRMHELLSAAPAELRGHWQEIIADTDFALADRLGLSLPVPATRKMPSAGATTTANTTTANTTAAKSTGFATITSALSAASAAAQSNTAVRAPSTKNTSSPLSQVFASTVVTTADVHFARSVSDADEEPQLLPFTSAGRSPSSGFAASGTATSKLSQSKAAADLSANAESMAADATLFSVPDVREVSALEQILELPSHKIAQVLAAASGEVLLLALAGATPQFMQRFTSLLEKQDARTLHTRLRKLGAINLQDIDEAQRRLCELATQVVYGQRVHRPTAVAA